MLYLFVYKKIRKMCMTMPKRWTTSSNFCLLETQFHLKKFQHFLNWKPNESILEVGFASGYNSSQSLQPMLPKDYKEFVATDISDVMVDYAKEHCDIRRSKFYQMDVAGSINEEFLDRFDHIFSFIVMHMVKNPREAFKNIHKMLKPGGTAFLTFFERIPCDGMFDELSRHPKWSKYGQEEMISSYFYSLNPEEEYKKDLEAAGFKNYVFEAEKGSYNFSSEQECNDILTSVNTVLPRIPKEDLEEYLKHFFEARDRCQVYDIKYENGKKNVTVNFTFFVAIVTK